MSRNETRELAAGRLVRCIHLKTYRPLRRNVSVARSVKKTVKTRSAVRSVEIPCILTSCTPINFGPHFVSVNSVAQKRFREYFIGFRNCMMYKGIGTSDARTKHPEKRTCGKKRAGLRATAPCSY